MFFFVPAQMHHGMCLRKCKTFNSFGRKLKIHQKYFFSFFIRMILYLHFFSALTNFAQFGVLSTKNNLHFQASILKVETFFTLL